MVWCLNKGQSRTNEQKESSGAANDDKGCMKEDERMREYRGTEVVRVNGETTAAGTFLHRPLSHN